jgi:dimethylglycine catabolism A
MWRPKERIKWKAEVARWPSPEKAAASQLFSPIKLGPVTARHRTWIPAMVPWRATEAGFVTPEVLDWYGRFARGKPGVLVVEATGVRDVPSGPLLRINDDRFIPGLKDLVRTVHEASDGETKLFIQIIDFLGIRRRPDPEKFFARFLKITNRHRQALEMPGATEGEVRERLAALDETALADVLTAQELEALRYGYRERVTDTHLPQISELPETLPRAFAAAAHRAKDVGFDGVELHYAHAYTMASFLSATNTRSDGYGGMRENRARLPLEVYRAVRQAVGLDFAVGARFLADECIAGGNDVGDAAWIATAFAEAGMDFLSLSRGGKFDDALQPAVGWAAYPYTGPSGYECMPQYLSDAQGPFGRNFAAAKAVRAAVRSAGFRVPVIVSGGVHGFDQAESVIASEVADVVALARQSLADPDWFTKVLSGAGATVRICEYTNYCEALDQKHKQVTCKLWDRIELEEPGILKSADGKRRLSAP